MFAATITRHWTVYVNGNQNNDVPKSIRVITLLVSNAIKLSGLVIAIHAALSESQPPPIVLGLSAFMMAGAQVSEDAIIKVFNKMFESKEPPPLASPQPDNKESRTG